MKTAETAGRPHLDICPPSLQDRDFLATEDRIELRPIPYSAPAALPAWGSHRNSRPLIYLTLGTAFGTPELLTMAIEGLATLDARVVVAAGRVRPDQLGNVPDNVTVQTWKLLPHHGHAGHRDAARAIAEEIARMPSPDEVARHLPEYVTRG